MPVTTGTLTIPANQFESQALDVHNLAGGPATAQVGIVSISILESPVDLHVASTPAGTFRIFQPFEPYVTMDRVRAIARENFPFGALKLVATVKSPVDRVFEYVVLK